MGNDITVLNDRDMNFGRHIEKPEWMTDMGGYNSAPKPFRKSTYKAFMETFRNQTPIAIESRQIMGEDCVKLGGKGEYSHVSATVFWFDTFGFMMVFPTNEWGMDKNGNIKYKHSAKYYKIGCQHESRELSQEECAKQGIYHAGQCWHVHRCEKCGMVTAYDSSD
jgi:hypothetical protein